MTGGTDTRGTAGGEPWYRTTLRWGQTNLTEIDPSRYDRTWWRRHWRRTGVQGVIVNAGGIVAYYPSAIPFHHRAEFLGDRDLYGEIVEDARAEGLAVVARMDSNRVDAALADAHPGWICRDASGTPFRAADKLITCINSGYYREYLPDVMREIIARSRPDGFSDNSWPGLTRERICHCDNCRSAFRAASGHGLPARADWSDDAYRRWIRWNYQRRTEQWAFNNRVTTEAGGSHCLWSGMISGDILANCQRFIDLRAVLAQTEIVMLDHQRRSLVNAFDQNTEAGKRLHEVAGWHKLIPESMPQYQLGSPPFRVSAMPVAEARLWATSGFAGGIQPWWHHIGAAHDDRRQYATAEPIFRWHEANADVLTNREPMADAGVVWSQDNYDFAGQDRPEERAYAPYKGVTAALDKAGLTWLPVAADDIAGVAGRMRVLLLPDLAAMSDAQAEAVRAFAASGGSVVATGGTGSLTEWGDKRPEPALAVLFGVRATTGGEGGRGPHPVDREDDSRHTYLRLLPELRAGHDGPADGAAPVPAGPRPPVLAGLDGTDLVPFGGFLPGLEAMAGTEVLATFVPGFPIFPPETSWLRRPRTDIPAIAVRDGPGGGRLAWFAADLDRCFARDENAEHAALLVNAVRWGLGGPELVKLEGARTVVTPTLYRQGTRTVLHLNNRVLTSRIPGRQTELIPVGPVHVRLRQPSGAVAPVCVSLRVAGGTVPASVEDGALVFEVAEVADHEVAVIDWT